MFRNSFSVYRITSTVDVAKSSESSVWKTCVDKEKNTQNSA